MHSDEVDIDEALVRRLIASQFPQFADLHLAPVPSAGTVNALYRLGDHLVVRLPRVARYADGLEKEYNWLPKLAPHLPLAIPEPLAMGTPADAYPFRWCIYRWLEGEIWSTDGVRDPCEAAIDLARFITALRRIDVTGAPRRPAGYDTLAGHTRYVRPAIAAARGLIDADAANAAWDAALALPAWGGPPVWVHGDLSRPGNLLVTGGRLKAVIDFGGISLGDPARELMAAWTLFAGESREAFRRALSVDDATWARGRAWTLTRVMNIAYYVETNPAIVAEARHAVREILADHERDVAKRRPV
jgi:aminoglycoside phosphotransferase (APT) family kinase protein